MTAGELDELRRYEEMAEEIKTKNSKLKTADGPGFIPKGIHRGKHGRFIKQGHGSRVTGHDFTELAAELKSVAALDGQFEEHFELEKYPRVKAALEQAISRRVEDIIKQRFAATEGTKKDYRRVTLMQLIEITGKKRRTIYFWIDRGLPREEDGTFLLPKVFEWLETYTENKTLERLPDRKMNPYQVNRARELAMHIAEREHQLLKRDEVMTGQVARHQNLINAFTHKSEELAMQAHGQPQSKIMELLGEFFDEVLRQQCSVPEQLHLPEEKAKLFSELLNSLNPKSENLNNIKIQNGQGPKENENGRSKKRTGGKNRN